MGRCSEMRQLPSALNVLCIQAAMEFGIKTMHFVPFEGGVIEYGVYLTP